MTIEQNYRKFIKVTASNETNNFLCFIERCHQLNGNGLDVQRLLTSAIGLSSELSELITEMRILERVVNYDSYSYNKIKNCIDECGDVLWYIAQGCNVFNVDLQDAYNVRTSHDITNYNDEVKYDLDKLPYMIEAAGQYSEIVKKIVFQNKTYDDKVKDTLIYHLGDILNAMRYVVAFFDLRINDVLQMNMDKLSVRFKERIENAATKA